MGPVKAYDGQNPPKSLEIVKVAKIAKNRFSSSATYGHALHQYGFSGYLLTFFGAFGSFFADFSLVLVLLGV